MRILILMFVFLPCSANQPWGKYEACPHLDIFRMLYQDSVNIRLSLKAKKDEYKFEYVGQVCSDKNSCTAFKLNGPDKIQVNLASLSIKTEKLFIYLEKPIKYECAYTILNF